MFSGGFGVRELGRPGKVDGEFVVGEGEEKTLIMRDAQHQYVFDAI